jgi:hypothetical protein
MMIIWKHSLFLVCTLPLCVALTIKAASADDADNVDWPRIVGFVSIDTNGDGSLSKVEFLQFLTTQSNHRHSEAAAELLFNRFDHNGDGQIDMGEWSHVLDSGILDEAASAAGGGGGAGPETLAAWSAALEVRLGDVPFTQMVASLKSHLMAGGTAKLTLEGAKVEIVLITATGTSTMSGRWG